MKRQKRLVILLLMLCLAMAALVACRDKEEKEEEKPEIVKGTDEEMLEAMSKVDAGTAYLELKTTGNQNLSAGIEIGFDRKKNAMSLSVGFSMAQNGAEKTMELKPTEIIRVVDGKLYFNLGSIKDLTEAVGKMTYSEKSEIIDELNLSGWFVIPLPKDLPETKVTDEAVSGVKAIFRDVLCYLTKEATDGSHKYMLEKPDQLIGLLTAAREYVDKDLRKLLISGSGTMRQNLKDIDVNAYVRDLIDFYEDDFRELVKAYGDEVNIKENDVDEMLRKLRSQDYAQQLEKYMEASGSGVNTLTPDAVDAYIREITDALDKAIADAGKDGAKVDPATVRLAADDDGYILEIKSSSADQTGSETTISFRLNPGTASPKKPSETRGLKAIMDLLSPSYLRYVDKSRRATDLSTLQEIMSAAEHVAADPMFDLPEGTRFNITLDGVEFRKTITVPDGDVGKQGTAEEGWSEISLSAAESQVRSKEVKQATGRIVGTIQADCSVKWELAEANDKLRELLKSSNGFYRYGFE